MKITTVRVTVIAPRVREEDYLTSYNLGNLYVFRFKQRIKE